MADAEQPRSIETEFEIDAPIEAVWRALTEGEELSNWFPLEAKVKPGVGGSVWVSWGPGVEFESPIAAWEENKHLKLIYFDATPPEQAEEAKAKGMFIPFQVSVDYHLESHGGNTVLRLIHSGFAADAAWDSQYDGTVRGWQFVLRGLKHYLENHRGSKRVVVEAKHIINDLSLDEAWHRVMSKSGLLAQGSINTLKPGDRYAFTMATGDEIQGIVHLNNPPQDFCATDKEHNNAFLLLKIDEASVTAPNQMVNLWLSTYGIAAEETDALQQRWDKMMSRLFASTPTA